MGEADTSSGHIMARPRLFAKKSIVGAAASASFSTLNQCNIEIIKKEAREIIVIDDSDDDGTTTTTTTTTQKLPIQLWKQTARKTAQPPPATSGGHQTLATTMAYHVMMRERAQQQQQISSSHCGHAKKEVVTPSPLVQQEPRLGKRKTVNHNYKMRKRSPHVNYKSLQSSSSSEEDNDENYRAENGNSNGNGSSTDDDDYKSYVDNKHFHIRRPRRNVKRLCRYRPTTDLKVLFKQEEEDDAHHGDVGNCNSTPRQIKKSPTCDQHGKPNNTSKNDTTIANRSKLKDPPPLSFCCFTCGLRFATKSELENHEKESYAV